MLHIKRTRYLALIIAFEAVFLESILNLSHLIIFKEYIFYYLPSELWHLTTVQAIPFYFIAGVVIVRLLRVGIQKPVFYSLISLVLVSVLIFLA